MNEELKKYYEYLKSVKADIPDTYESFAETLSDETQARVYFDYLKANKFDTPDTFENFSDTFGLKKKDLSFLDVITTTSGKEPLPFTGQSKPSLNQPQPSPLTDTGSYGGDILERIGAGALDIASSGPKQLRFAQRIIDMPKKIALKELKLLGLSDKTAEKISKFIPYLKPPIIGDAVNISSEVWNKIEKTDEFQNIEKKADELRESSARYDQTIQSYLKSREYNKAIGASFLVAAESFPLTLTAMFGGNIGLTAMGLYSASAQYDEISSIPDMNEAQKITNALINGGLEIATERLGSANYGRLIKSLYKTAGKEVAEVSVKKGMKSWFVNMFKKIGLFTAPVGEGLEEAVNQFGSNITARITGEDPDRPLDYGVVDSWAEGTAGGTTFIAMGLPGQLRQQKYEETIKEKEKETTATKKTEKSVETTDKGTVTEEVGELEVPEEVEEQKEAELKIGDKTFDTKEKLFKHLDETAITEEGEMTYALPNLGEYPSTATVEAVQEWTDIKEAEKIAKNNDLTFIGQQKGDTREESLDQYNIKVGDQEATFSVPLGSMEDVVQEKKQETIDKFKITEETKDAERIREEVESTGEQAQGVVEGEEGGLRVRDTEKDRVETEQGEEVAFKQFVDIVNESKTPEEAFKKAQEVKGITEEESKAFRDKYDPEGKLTPQQAFDVFYNEIKAKEAISEEIPESEGVVPPPPEKTVEAPEIAPKGQKPLGAQERALNQYETEQQQVVSDVIEENKEFYTVLSGTEAMDNARTFIKDKGIDGATRELEKPIPNANEAPTRQVARLILLDNYSRILGNEGATKAERDNAYNVINKLQEMVSKEANKWGQANAHLHLWKAMQPSGQLEFVKRKIDEYNQKKLDKQVKGSDKTAGQLLDMLYNTLSEDSKKIIDDILEGKDISGLISKEPTKPPIPPKRKSIPKEKIKQEQDYRKNLIDEYRKKNKGITLQAGIPVSAAQMELGGNLIASYVREGYYRLEDIVEKLKKDLALAGIKVEDEQISKILEQKKDEGGTYRDYVTKQTEELGLKEEMKSQKMRIQDVVRRHWSERDEMGRNLADKLVDDAYLTPEEAKKISDAILKQFNEKIVERIASNKDLAKLLGTQKIPKEKGRKTILNKVLEIVNLRPLQSELYRPLFAEKFGLAIELTAEQGKEIIRRASVVQQVSNKGWFHRDAVIDLSKYIYELQPQSRKKEFAETWISLSYANMLSGIPTSVLNLWSAGSNIVSKPSRDLVNLTRYARLIKEKKGGKRPSAAIYNPIGQMFWVALADGVTKGAVDASEVYVNGDVGSKYIEEIAHGGQFKVGQLERNKYGKSTRFQPIKIKIGKKTLNVGNPFNLAKYVGRNLAAQDRLMFNTAFELELVDIIWNNEATKGLSGKELVRKTMEIYKGRLSDETLLSKQLTDEAIKYKELTGKTITQRQANIRYRELLLQDMVDKGYIADEQKREAEALARSNIFTDDRSGMIATLASGIGQIANSNVAAGLIVKPFVPFTKIVGNVTEYMLDHTPIYGFLRANGKSISAIKKLFNPNFETAQMGEKGSRAYEEQMGRAWFGTIAFGTILAMALGNDDEDFLEISGGYEEEIMRGKTGRENVLPPYNIRFGKFKISYLNIPVLAVPLALIGNINDGLKQGLSEEDIWERLSVALLATSALKTMTMVKDMSFVQGVKSFLDLVGDMSGLTGSAIERGGKTMLKYYLGFGLRPLPWNSVMIQQMWKIFDPTSYSQKDIKGILSYGMGIQHFVSHPSIDQLGDTVKTYPGERLMPYTHWMNIKGKDERWKFLSKYNAIPSKIKNIATTIESKDGIERRPLEPEEFYEYTRLAGKLFSDKLEKYMKDKENLKIREADRTTKFDSQGEEVTTTGIQDDVLELWNIAKDDARDQQFRWVELKKNHLPDWKKMVNMGALPSPSDAMQVEDADGNKIDLTREQLHEFNKKAIEYYRQYVMKYLRDTKVTQKDQEIDPNTGDSYFNGYIKKDWADAKAVAKKDIEDKLITNK